MTPRAAPRVTPRVTAAGLGAWLLKGNADRVDLAGRFARDPRIERWCVQGGYRARLMEAGQSAVFWASGSRARLAYGVWGAGVLTGAAQAEPDGGAADGGLEDTGPAGPRDGGWWVPLDVAVLPPDRWVSRTLLRADPRLADLEVLRQPQAGNPSFLTVAQFDALQDYL